MSIREPSIDRLLDKIDSKYKIAYIAAKRARQISQDGLSQFDYADDLGEEVSVKAVGIALEEIYHDAVNFELAD